MIWALLALLLPPLQGGAWMPVLDVPSSGRPSAIEALSDRDGDGRSEILAGYADEQRIEILAGASGAVLLIVRDLGSSGDFGGSVARLGDLDLDGFEDFAVGSSGDSSQGFFAHGAVYVLSGLSGSVLATAYGSVVSEYFGHEVRRAGDLDADGWEDLLVLGRSSPSSSHAFGITAISARTGSALYRKTPPYGDFGFCAIAGSLRDWDRDGVPEFAAAIADADTQGLTRNGWIGWFSGATGAMFGEISGAVSGQSLGYVIAGVSDLDSDGFDELLAAGGPTSASAGQVFSGADGRVLFRIDADPMHPGMWDCGGGGADFDGDGLRDLFVGTGSADAPGEMDNGAVSIHSGVTGGLQTRIYGEKLRGIGRQAVVAEDLNQDSRPDLLTLAGYPYPGGILGFADSDLLAASRAAISAAAGGTVDFTLAFPLADSVRAYLILASASGTGPVNFGGIFVPLTPDALYRRMILAPPSFFRGVRGVLDAEARAEAQLNLHAGAAFPLVGRTLHLAAVTYEGVLARQSSRAISLQILP